MVSSTPASRLATGNRDLAFRTKPQLAADLVEAARKAGIGFRAVVADCTCGDNAGFTEALGQAKVADVLAVKPSKGGWAPAKQVPTPCEAAAKLAWTSPGSPATGPRVTRRFRDGHTQTWWAADARLPAAGWGPDRRLRLVVATTDPATLPQRTTWYLLTNLPHPAGRTRSAFAPADLAEVVRLDSLRNWVEHGDKQVNGELGWAEVQVRGARAIRRHWQLVCCAFSCCWQGWFAEPPPAPSLPDATPASAGARGRRPVTRAGMPSGVVAWPLALRRVRAWLTPWVVLGRCWRAWSTAPASPAWAAA